MADHRDGLSKLRHYDKCERVGLTLGYASRICGDIWMREVLSMSLDTRLTKVLFCNSMAAPELPSLMAFSKAIFGACFDHSP